MASGGQSSIFEEQLYLSQKERTGEVPPLRNIPIMSLG